MQFVATAEALDDDMSRRIAAHRLRRPVEWSTLEEPVDLASRLPSELEGYDTCLLDCLTVWVSNLLLSTEDGPDVEDEILAALDRVIEVYESSSATWIVVSNEVGLGVVPSSPLGVVPSSPLGRTYRDVLGRVNQAVAARADKVFLMVAGLALEMKSMGARPFTGLKLFDE